MTIGQRIRERRESLNMSQDELAKKLGYSSRSSINKIESDIYNLKQSKIKMISDALETTPSYIMGWDDVKESDFIAPINGDVSCTILVEVLRGPHKEELLSYAKYLHGLDLSQSKENIRGKHE